MHEHLATFQRQIPTAGSHHIQVSPIFPFSLPLSISATPLLLMSLLCLLLFTCLKTFSFSTHSPPFSNPSLSPFSHQNSILLISSHPSPYPLHLLLSLSLLPLSIFLPLTSLHLPPSLPTSTFSLYPSFLSPSSPSLPTSTFSSPCLPPPFPSLHTPLPSLTQPYLLSLSLTTSPSPPP